MSGVLEYGGGGQLIGYYSFKNVSYQKRSDNLKFPHSPLKKTTDVPVCSLNLFHSHGASKINERSRKVVEQSLLTNGIISKR